MQWTAIYGASAQAVKRVPLTEGLHREVLDASTIDALFADDPGRAETFHEHLARGHIGVAIVDENGWVGYVWLAFAEMPADMPRQIGGRPWIFSCHTKEPQRARANYAILLSCLLDEACRRGLEDREQVYVDVPMSNLDVRRSIEDAGFMPAGRLFKVRPPGSRRSIGRWTAWRWPVAGRFQWRTATVVSAVTLAAIAVGFFVGQSGGGSASGVELRKTASAGALHVRLPADWRPQPPPLAGSVLALTDELALGPDTPTGGTLVVGRTDTSDQSLLPQPLLAGLPAVPKAQTVALGALRFYRYQGVSLDKRDKLDALYARPTTVGTVIGACLPRADPGFTSLCQRVLSTLRLSIGTMLPLGPSSGYAQGLNQVIGKLNAVRSSAGPLLRAPGAQRQAKAARTLAVAHADAASAVLGLSGGPTAANSALASALRMAGLAYGAVARAVVAHDAGAYRAAQASLARATTALDSGFAQLGKLGYRVG